MYKGKKVGVVVPAGGAGRRLGADRPKQLLEIDGLPLFVHSLKTFLSHSAIDQVLLVHPAKAEGEYTPHLKGMDVFLTEGGAERHDSVKNGILALDDDVDWVLVHDAARPFLPTEVIDRILEALEHGPCIAALPCADTVKQVSSDLIEKTLDRNKLWLAQTPQAFEKKLMMEIYAKSGKAPVATDEAGQLEAAGYEVRVVLGSRQNAKITTQEDLSMIRPAT